MILDEGPRTALRSMTEFEFFALAPATWHTTTCNCLARVAKLVAPEARLAVRSAIRVAKLVAPEARLAVRSAIGHRRLLASL